MTFFIQLETKKRPKTSQNFDFIFFNNCFSKIGLKMIKLCNMIYKLQYSAPKMSNVLHYIFIKIRKFDCNFGGGAKIYYFSHIYCQYCQLGFSSKIEVLQLGLAWLRTFIARLELENSSSNSSLRVSMQCM